jgi:hypothetical protein
MATILDERQAVISAPIQRWPPKSSHSMPSKRFYRLPAYRAILWIGLLVPPVQGALVAEPNLAQWIDSINAVGPNATGHREAAAAWQKLSKAEAGQLPQILTGMDHAGPLAANWLRAAVDTIAERTLRQNGALPAEALEAFVRQTSHAPRARRAAYEWLARVDATAKARLLPTMLDDPSPELRRDAVEAVAAQAASRNAAGQSQKAEAIVLYRKALDAARDLDQIDDLVGRLNRLGEKVDLARSLGYVLKWKIIGPFDNTGNRGFEGVYPPEKEYREQAISGKDGPVQWQDFTGDDPHGLIDLNRVLGEKKAVVGYCRHEFTTQKPVEAEIRMSSENALRLWVNGSLIGSFSTYHSGNQQDQYICRTKFQAGRNVILLKVCQNAQTQDWARIWAFQLRVCDVHGKGLVTADLPPGDNAGNAKNNPGSVKVQANTSDNNAAGGTP